MGTMKAQVNASAFYMRPYSIVTVLLLVAFVVAFTMPSVRFGLSTVGFAVALIALPFVGKQTSPVTRWIERVTMLQFAILFLQWVAK